MRFSVWALFLFLLLASLPALATNVTVDCNAAQTINAAVASLDLQGPHTINVSGNCTENVSIFSHERLSIFAAPGTTLAPSNPNGRVLSIFQSRAINIDGLTITGGRGVAVNDSSAVTLTNLSIQNSALQGLTINEGSHVNASVLNVSNNGRGGITVNGGSSLNIDTSIIENNTNSGISLNNGRLVVFGGDGTPGTETLIRGNGNGIGVSGPAYLEVDDDVRLQNNRANGIQVIHNAAAFLGGAGLIEGNGGNGIYLGETSHLEVGGFTIRNNGTNPAAPNGRDGIHVVENAELYIDGGANVTGNAGHGVSIDYASVLSSLGANAITSNSGDGVFIHANGTGHWWATDSITGNAGASISCDTTSLVTGDISGATAKDVKCSRVERDNGPPRGGTTTQHLHP